MSGWVTFRVGGRDLAGALQEVREVVRAGGVEAIAGTRAPVSGVLILRGFPLPVVDLREAGAVGDVLVLAGEGADQLGLAVDGVLAVLPHDALRADDAVLPSGLPAYVRGVLRSPGSPDPLLLVDLRALAAGGAPAPPGASRATEAAAQT